MLNRREFLTTAAGGFVTLLLTPILSACGSDSSPSTSTTTNPTNPTCDGAGETSSVTLGHTHTLCVPRSDLDNPPVAGATYTTGPAATDGHQHQVVMTQAQLMLVSQGQTVNVMTTTIEGHTHDFAVQKAAPSTGATPPPTSPPAPGPFY